MSVGSGKQTTNGGRRGRKPETPEAAISSSPRSRSHPFIQDARTSPSNQYMRGYSQYLFLALSWVASRKQLAQLLKVVRFAADLLCI